MYFANKKVPPLLSNRANDFDRCNRLFVDLRAGMRCHLSVSQTNTGLLVVDYFVATVLLDLISHIAATYTVSIR